MREETNPMKSSSEATAPSVLGSLARMPNSRLWRNRLEASAAARPRIINSVSVNFHKMNHHYDLPLNIFLNNTYSLEKLSKQEMVMQYDWLDYSE